MGSGCLDRDGRQGFHVQGCVHVIRGSSACGYSRDVVRVQKRIAPFALTLSLRVDGCCNFLCYDKCDTCFAEQLALRGVLVCILILSPCALTYGL